MQTKWKIGSFVFLLIALVLIGLDGAQAVKSTGKATSRYDGWQIKQKQYATGECVLYVCLAGFKIVNPLFEVSSRSNTKSIAIVNNQDRKYFLCTPDNVIDYFKLVGFRFSPKPSPFRYSPWKKEQTKKIFGLTASLYSRDVLNPPPGRTKHEEQWVTSDVPLPANFLTPYYRIGSNKQDPHGLPLTKRVTVTGPYKEWDEWRTIGAQRHTFSPHDFDEPTEFKKVVNFSELLLSDSDSREITELGKKVEEHKKVRGEK